MITPTFSTTQTSRSITLSIRAPHSRPRDIDYTADKNDFHFHSSPYLLHIHFPHPVSLHPQDDPTVEPPPSSYDIETGIATITLHKFPPYPHFANLDMLSALLVSRTAERKIPTIEVVSTTVTPSETSNTPSVTTQSGLTIPISELSIGRPTYGFANRYEAVFKVRSDDASQIVELPNPDDTPVWRRRSLRKATEDKRFNYDHYVADLYDQDSYLHVLQFTYKPPDTSLPLPASHAQVLLNLPRREYLPDIHTRAAADLAGLLYACLYDNRVTLGERCSESAWTISKVCATMAFLDSFSNPHDAVLAAYRRTLVYPLYRNITLADLVLADLKTFFAAPDLDTLRSRLLRVLLEVKQLFEDDLLLRLHSDLFLIDYCVWIQTVDNTVLDSLQQELADISIKRHELEWNLDALEFRAKKIWNGEGVYNAPMPDFAAKNDTLLISQPKHRQIFTNQDTKLSNLSPHPHTRLIPGVYIEPVSTRKIFPLEAEETDDSYTYDYDSESVCS